MQFDLRGRDLEAIMDFIFDHPVPAISDEPGWWWASEIEVDPEEYAGTRVHVSLNGALWGFEVTDADGYILAFFRLRDD
jgi:hypothetical protein